MNQTLTEARFRALAEAYGSALERWPAAEQNAARELLLRKPELRALLDAERELDRLFGSVAPASVPEALLSRLHAVPERVQPFPVRPRALFLPAVGWAAAAALGLWLGATFDEPAFSAEAALTLDEEPSELELAAGDFDSLEEAP
jgi:hypothetical protein